jgi:hypothetical protein
VSITSQFFPAYYYDYRIISFSRVVRLMDDFVFPDDDPVSDRVSPQHVVKKSTYSTRTDVVLDPKGIVARLTLPSEPDGAFQEQLQFALASLEKVLNTSRSSMQERVASLEADVSSAIALKARGVENVVRRAQQEQRLRAAMDTKVDAASSAASAIAAGDMAALLAKLAGEPTEAEKLAAREARMRAARESALSRVAGSLAAVTGGSEVAAALADKRARAAEAEAAARAEAAAEAARYAQRLAALPPRRGSSSVGEGPGVVPLPIATGPLAGSASALQLLPLQPTQLMRGSASMPTLPPLPVRQQQQQQREDAGSASKSSSAASFMTSVTGIQQPAQGQGQQPDRRGSDASAPASSSSSSSRLLAALEASAASASAVATPADDEALALSAALVSLREWLEASVHDLAGAVLAPATAAMTAMAAQTRDQLLWLNG